MITNLSTVSSIRKVLKKLTSRLEILAIAPRINLLFARSMLCAKLELHAQP